MDRSTSWRLGYFDASEVPEYLCMQANRARFREFREAHRERSGPPFYVTVVPRTLDLLEVCLDLLPRSLNLFLILNGVEEWERAHVDSEFAGIPSFALETHSGSILYDRVLDLLFESHDTPFGILDPDCFVIDAAVFDEFRLEPRQFALAPFVSSNPVAGIDFPRTYFLFFDTALVKRIREEHRLSSKRCWTIPSQVEEKLAALGFGYHNFPHRSLSYFDNFQLIWATALAEGLTFGRIRVEKRWTFRRERRWRIVHVGAGHNYLTREYRDGMAANLSDYDRLPLLEQEKLRAAAFSHYAHLLLLEHSSSDALRARYLPFFSVYEGARDVLRGFGSLIEPARGRQLEFVVEEVRRRKARGIAR